MSGKCKGCGSEARVRNGIQTGKQRYKCKDCGQTHVNGDKRSKYDIPLKLKCIKLYLEGMGIRSIERLEGVHNTLIIQWIRNMSKLLKKKLDSTSIPEDVKDISILEIDELFSYCKKKKGGSIFGLLWTETGIKLLILK